MIFDSIISDITIDNFWNIIGSPSVTTDLAGGTFNGYWTSEVLLSGTMDSLTCQHFHINGISKV